MKKWLLSELGAMQMASLGNRPGKLIFRVFRAVAGNFEHRLLAERK